MREDYVPNEKYRNMFGVERNGYGMERVDLYLAQLEVAFKKIREDNRNLQREITKPGAPPLSLVPDAPAPSPALAAQVEQQEQYIARLQAQLAEQQAQNQRLLAQLSEQRSEAAPQGQPQFEALVAQMNALRAEADMLRQQLRRQQAAPVGAAGYPPEPGDQQSLIGKVLVEAKAQAEETLRAARQEADQITVQARRQTEALRAEQDRIYTQLQGVSYALRNVLRDSTQLDYKQRGEEFAAS